MMRVRGCAPSNEDERDHSVQAAQELVTHVTRRVPDNQRQSEKLDASKRYKENVLIKRIEGGGSMKFHYWEARRLLWSESA